MFADRARQASSPFINGNDVNAKALWHFEGADEATTGTVLDDSSIGGSNHPLTSFGGAAAETSNTISGFGSALELTGSSQSRMQAADHADFKFGSSDFTVEGRFRSDSAAQSHTIIEFGTGNTFRNWIIFKDTSTLTFFASSSNTSFDIFNAAAIKTGIALNTWYTFAVERFGDQFYGYVDGVLEWTPATTSQAISSGAGELHIGSTNTSTQTFDGLIEEVRISDIARYKGVGYTPETLPWG